MHNFFLHTTGEERSSRKKKIEDDRRKSPRMIITGREGRHAEARRKDDEMGEINAGVKNAS